VKVLVEFSWFKLQFQALIVEDGASHSGVGEVTMCTILMQVQPQICLAPWEISPTLRSQSCLSFAPTSGVLFLFPVTGIFSLHLPNSVNCKYLLKGPKRPTKQ
jgi:hypothetical protein